MQNNIIQFNKEASRSPLLDEKFIRAKNLQKIFDGVAQSTIDSWVKAGLIKRHKILGSVFYKHSEVLELIEKSIEE